MTSSGIKYHGPENSVFINATNLSSEDFSRLAKLTVAEREINLKTISKHEWTKDNVTEVTPMTAVEETVAVLTFLFGVPGAVFSIPILLLLIGYIVGSVTKVLLWSAVVFVPLTIIPARFREEALGSWWAFQMLRYFSFKGVTEEFLAPGRPYILVAPPHGVFPFGNITTMIAFPSIMGYSMQALAASAAVSMPIFKHVLVTLGAISASKSNAVQALRGGASLGISTGGVAEVFETQSDTGDQYVVLRSRKGIIRLAFTTGAALVPCYLFGNTELLSLWTGRELGLHSTLRTLSRKLGVALIVFWGRFLLPIPYRVPIFGVMGRSIPVPLKPDPTDEEVDGLHALLCERMVQLFDRYKESYGWKDKKLIII